MVLDRTQFLQTQSSCPWEKTWYNTWRRKKFIVVCICWQYVYVFVAKVFFYLLPCCFFNLSPTCFLNLLLIVTHFEWLVAHRSPLRRSEVTPSIALSLVRTLLCTFFGSLNLCNEAMSKHILPFNFSNLNVLRWIIDLFNAVCNQVKGMIAFDFFLVFIIMVSGQD